MKRAHSLLIHAADNPLNRCALTPHRVSRRTMMRKIGYVAVATALGIGCVSAAQAHVFVGMSVGMPVVPVMPTVPVVPVAPVTIYAPASPYYAPPPVYAPPVAVGYWGRPAWWGPRYAVGYWR
jgi:hypothetical protein